MINVIQNDKVYEISFPYDINVISLIKNVPGRCWVPERKIWTIPLDRLGFLINQFKGTDYESSLNIVSDEKIGENQNLSTTIYIPNIDISNFDPQVKEGYSLYQHQIDFLKWSVNRERSGHMQGFVLADSQGLGKTLEVMNLALYNKQVYGYKHCLIICCINSSKYNWQHDILVHTKGKYAPYIIGSRLKRNGEIHCNTGGKEKFEDLSTFKMYGKADGDTLPYFLILNIESLRYKVGRNKVIADTIIHLMNRGEINMVAVDEIHKNASMTSQQGKQLLRIKKNVNTTITWIPMTGTPITKQPTDVFLPLKLCDGHTFDSFYTWCKQFCIYGGFGGHEIIGYKNIDTLKSLLEPNMIRRLKEDVLDLPPKILYTEYIENTEYQNKLYKTVALDLLEHRDEVMMNLNPLAKFLRLRQVNGSPELVDENMSIEQPDYLSKNAKLQRLLELIDEIVERGEKVVVFSNWVEPIRTLYRYISSRYKTCVFTGTMSLEDREQHKRVFMNNKEYKVLLGTIGAAGTAQTFTAASNVIFYDSPWNPSDKEQAEDRVYRIGTTSSVNIYTLVTKNTIDERVEQILQSKDSVAKYIVDNKLDLRKNPELFEFLIGSN